jgi:phosphohistidine phosphatase SixA
MQVLSKAVLHSAVAAVALLAASFSASAEELKGDALFTALKKGGYVIYLRHAASDTSQSDADPIEVANCKTQRNLSDAGRAQAKEIGKAMEQLGIGVDAVLTSPYCRAKDTGMLAFGKATPSDALYYSLGLPKDAAAKAAADLKAMLGKAPPAGKNTVLVGHTSNLKEVAGVWPKSEGAAFVLEPKGGAFSVIGSFSAADLLKAGG